MLLPEEEEGLSFPFVIRTDELPHRPPSIFKTLNLADSLAYEGHYKKAFWVCIRWFGRLDRLLLYLIVTRLFKGWPRWWVWGIVCATLSDCPPGKKHDYRRIKVASMTFGDKSISLWHLRWVKRFHPEQYRLPEMEYQQAIYGELRERYHWEPPKRSKDITDPPDLVTPLLEDIQEAVETAGDFIRPPQ